MNNQKMLDVVTMIANIILPDECDHGSALEIWLRAMKRKAREALESHESEAVGNAAAMRAALLEIETVAGEAVKNGTMELPQYSKIVDIAEEALSAQPHKGKWKNGTMYEYEYAYCSECGRSQWAGWDTHEQAKENIESFARDYKFCPGCGAEMEGGVYVK